MICEFLSYNIQDYTYFYRCESQFYKNCYILIIYYHFLFHFIKFLLSTKRMICKLYYANFTTLVSFLCHLPGLITFTIDLWILLIIKLFCTFYLILNIIFHLNVMYYLILLLHFSVSSKEDVLLVTNMLTDTLLVDS